VGKIDADKTKNQMGTVFNETCAFLYLHPLDSISFDATSCADTLVNTYNVKPIYTNFQNNFTLQQAQQRMEVKPKKKRCTIASKIKTTDDPKSRYMLLKHARRQIVLLNLLEE
jgi:hypothetical protein